MNLTQFFKRIPEPEASHVVAIAVMLFMISVVRSDSDISLSIV